MNSAAAGIGDSGVAPGSQRLKTLPTLQCYYAVNLSKKFNAILYFPETIVQIRSSRKSVGQFEDGTYAKIRAGLTV
jgi:hypothetical protein